MTDLESFAVSGERQRLTGATDFSEVSSSLADAACCVVP